jgi:hypothetical protein
MRREKAPTRHGLTNGERECMFWTMLDETRTGPFQGLFYVQQMRV